MVGPSLEGPVSNSRASRKRPVSAPRAGDTPRRRAKGCRWDSSRGPADRPCGGYRRSCRRTAGRGRRSRGRGNSRWKRASESWMRMRRISSSSRWASAGTARRERHRQDGQQRHASSRSWRVKLPVGVAQLVCDCEMVRARHRDQRPRQVLRRALFVERAAVADQRRQLGRAVGDGKRLVDHRQTQRRQQLDHRRHEPQLLVEVGVADRPQVEHAGDGEAGLTRGWEEALRREDARRPTSPTARPCRRCRAPVRGPPASRARR